MKELLKKILFALTEVFESGRPNIILERDAKNVLRRLKSAEDPPTWTIAAI